MKKVQKKNYILLVKFSLLIALQPLIIMSFGSEGTYEVEKEKALEIFTGIKTQYDDLTQFEKSGEPFVFLGNWDQLLSPLDLSSDKKKKYLQIIVGQTVKNKKTGEMYPYFKMIQYKKGLEHSPHISDVWIGSFFDLGKFIIPRKKNESLGESLGKVLSSAFIKNIENKFSEQTFKRKVIPNFYLINDQLKKGYYIYWETLDITDQTKYISLNTAVKVSFENKEIILEKLDYIEPNISFY